MMVLTLLGHLLIAGGVVLLLLAALGLWRFPDLHTRLHALTKADTAGVALVALGAGLLSGSAATLVPLTLCAVLVAISGATTGHLIARSALDEEHASWRSTRHDSV
ncbi:Na+/H+ antiporter subunit G [Meridianimarinicoccus roseus]|jgi:multicomponent Na+:H+ antiporter subunit G|uniref:Na+/H+ antiporter subunit G n=1 Tax=Meridianimarinicoccus roseus TaxID=2072018 RepID=A0A2V2LGS1_9RHOB|nr:monovalent cation/H(+) antiporter subunit G [Meridianimarinicoccus roseus]PWR01103.1 Na+/H+ antiporter subunit G [Meridianimarinicoccus roseus]